MLQKLGFNYKKFSESSIFIADNVNSQIVNLNKRLLCKKEF